MIFFNRCFVKYSDFVLFFNNCSDFSGTAQGDRDDDIEDDDKEDNDIEDDDKEDDDINDDDIEDEKLVRV
tara:strand:+ start:132 stop:341 length:210 start_codon:yes stop_codon:yes gene_type:complete